MERQRNQKLWEWKLTKVSGDSLKLAQGCTSICWQEHLIISSELNQKTPQLWSWYLSCAHSTIYLWKGYSNCPFAAFKWQCYLPYWNLKQKHKLLPLALNFPCLAPVSPGRTASVMSHMLAHASFKLISGDHFLLKGHTVPVYLNHAKVSITFLSHGQYSTELRSKLSSYHLLRKAKKISHCQLRPCEEPMT